MRNSLFLQLKQTALGELIDYL